MNNTALLDLSSISFDTKIQGKSKTPSDVGNSLFKTLLAEHSGSSETEILGTSLYSKRASTKLGSSGKNSESNSNDLQALYKKISDLGLPIAQMILPESALPQLISFFEGQGFSTEKINQMITSARNKDGLLQIDKLLAQLAGNEKVGLTDKNSSLVQSSDIPKIEDILFKMGLGAGEVKEAVEKSINQEGDLDLGKLKAALEKTLPGISSGSILNSLVKDNNIKLKPNIIDEKTIDPDLKKEFTNFLQTPSQDLQQEVKQNIANLLREKGIQPQEVKSFLETLNVDSTKSLLDKDASTTSDSDFLNQVLIKNNTSWQKREWNEKILKVLKNEGLLVQKDVNKTVSQGQGDIKLNMVELLKKGDLKGDLTSTQENVISVSEDRVPNESEKAEFRVESSGRTPLLRNELGTDTTLQKIDKESRPVNSVSQAKDSYNLPQPLPKVVDRMVWMIRAGEQNGRIMLHPPELGRLDLDLAIKNGHLQAHLSAESPVAKEIIEANLSQLKQQLNDQGLIVDRFEVMVGLNNRGFKEGDTWTWNERRGSSSKRRPGADVDDFNIEDGSLGQQSMDNYYQVDMHV